MNTGVIPPFEKLRWFKSLLGLTDDSLPGLDRYRDVFTSANKVFAHAFFDHFNNIPETRIYLEHQRHPGHLEKAWAGWFALLFNEGFSERFLAYQWKSGLRHVEVGIDHRFIILGYSYLRQFCQEIIGVKVPADERESILREADKVVDLCLLVETQAFIEATAQCDIEVVRGLSHQVRNPLTVIGGNIARLKKRSAPDDPTREVYDILMAENKRLEAMVDDAAAYSEMFQRESLFSRVSLRELIPETIERLKKKSPSEGVEISLDLNPDASEVQADKGDMITLFLHLLENAVEAADPSRPLVRVSSKRWEGEPSFVEVEIFNTGKPLGAEEIAGLFVPFSSTKPFGTGFGLSIARLAARKNLGDLLLEPVPGEGVRTLVKLPAADGGP